MYLCGQPKVAKAAEQKIAHKLFFERNMNFGITVSDLLYLKTEDLVCRHVLLNGHFNDGPFLFVCFVSQRHVY
ncbi:hypothetical protein EBU58_15915, partial [bacterium]|nr:hypothetical protein [bacterium]